MADNVTLNTGSGGDSIGADDISSVKYQRVKLIEGADGTNDGDISAANPLPVQPIAGQVGVQGGAGAVTALTQRVVLATDTTLPNVSGDVAHDSADSGNPVKVGGKAIVVGAAPTPVTANDRTQANFTRDGQLFVFPGHPNTFTFRANYTSAQTNAAIVTQAAGGKLVATRCTVSSDVAMTTNPAVRIGFATATTPTGTGTIFSHPGIPPGAHFPEGNGGGPLGIGADDEDIRVTTGTITTGSIDVVVTGFVLPS